MADSVSSKSTEEWLRSELTNKGFKLSPKRAHGETGVDILARKRGTCTWHIEVIGYKKSAPMRARDFFEAFFRSVSRLNDGAKHCAIALPCQAKLGLPERARRHGIAWMRIAKAFPELEIWLVDPKYYERTRWDHWVRVGGNAPLFALPCKEASGCSQRVKQH